MAVDEVILSLLISTLITKLSKHLESESTSYKLYGFAKILSDLERWKNTLVEIQPVLVDAGNEKIENDAFQSWLQDLHDLAYDIDDLLDDLLTQISGHGSAKGESFSGAVLKILIPVCTGFTRGNNVSELDNINTRLEDLDKSKDSPSGNVERPRSRSSRVIETSQSDKYILESTANVERSNSRSSQVIETSELDKHLPESTADVERSNSKSSQVIETSELDKHLLESTANVGRSNSRRSQVIETSELDKHLLESTANVGRSNSRRSQVIETPELDKEISELGKYLPESTANVERSNSRSSQVIETPELDKEISELGKEITELTGIVERSNSRSSQVTEPSQFDESKFVGRGKDREALLRKLLGDDACTQKISVVSLVGMGGIGKTTLANIVYYNKKVKQHFHIRAWVSVSDGFNVLESSKAIFQYLRRQKNSADLNMLQASLKKMFSKKRFLLVIDDVWNVDHMMWEQFLGLFALAGHGSKIIVTTRNTMVASAVDSIEAYHLEILSDEEATSLFAQHALGKENFDAHLTLKSHGQSIVNKCNGLPLALVSLGKILQNKKTDKEWKEFLNSWIWDLGDENKILPSLRLSYKDLPPHLRQMFTYCSLFPKEYVFYKNELVLMWLALGFLNHFSANKSLERFGHECFEELESRSFFQQPNVDKSGYMMNHLIHDLATSVGKEYFYRLDDNMDAYNKNKALEKVHHFSFIRQQVGVYTKFKELQRIRRLRTFLAVSVRLEGRQNLFLLNNILFELLPNLQFLRVLNLTSYSITELPHSIGSLKLIRYLNCSQTNITHLPEQVSDLHNLESLLLRGCNKLVRLPNSFKKLKNLRHFDITGTPRLKKIPLGIEKLMSLQTLSKVIIEGDNGFNISYLQGLYNLQGHLSIEGVQKVKDAEQANMANLQQKKGLHDLELEWSDFFDDSRNDINEYSVLEGLRPHDGLRKLTILFYAGKKFPSWIGDPSFVRLIELSLRGCRSCTHLPTLGHLRSLQKLFVESMNEVKTIGFDLLGRTNSFHHIAFPSLVVLEFKDMLGWEEWSFDGDDTIGTTTAFPSLRKISVLNCPKLAVVSFGIAFPSLDLLEFKNMQSWGKWSGVTASFPRLDRISLVNCLKLNEVSINSIPSLQNLHIHKCSKAVLVSMVGLSSSIVELIVENIKGLTHLPEEVIRNLAAVEYLCIKWCDDLRWLWKSESEVCKFLVSLQKLEVSFCKWLVSLAEKESRDIGNMDVSIKSVKEVNIHDCERLKQYYCPDTIEKLVISTCFSLTSLTFPDKPPSTLKYFDIRRCNLEEGWLHSDFLTPLESLEIVGLPKLKLFSEDSFVHLTKLVIRGCDDIESIHENVFLCLPLRYLEIIHCKNLKSFPHQHLVELTSMEQLLISHCPQVDESFPCGKWPGNLSTLTIGGLNKPMSDWGTQNFPSSLVTLYLQGQNSGGIPFGKGDDSSPCLLPPSLTFLEINGFKNLKSLSNGLQHLTSLEGLVIDACPKLGDLPEKLLPKLLSLRVYYCPKLQQICHSKKGGYRKILSQIPELYV